MGAPGPGAPPVPGVRIGTGVTEVTDEAGVTGVTGVTGGVGGVGVVGGLAGVGVALAAALSAAEPVLAGPVPGGPPTRTAAWRSGPYFDWDSERAVELRGPNGERIVVQTDRKPGRLHIHAALDHDAVDALPTERYHAATKAITVAADRPAQAIANAIGRQILPTYREVMAEGRAAVDAEYARRRSLAAAAAGLERFGFNFNRPEPLGVNNKTRRVYASHYRNGQDRVAVELAGDGTTGELTVQADTVTLRAILALLFEK